MNTGCCGRTVRFAPRDENQTEDIYREIVSWAEDIVIAIDVGSLLYSTGRVKTSWAHFHFPLVRAKGSQGALETRLMTKKLTGWRTDEDPSSKTLPFIIVLDSR